MGSKKAKTVYLSKVRVDPKQLKAWQSAFESYRDKHGAPDMSFASWVRLACETMAQQA